jgi:hypothetical protein
MGTPKQKKFVSYSSACGKFTTLSRILKEIPEKAAMYCNNIRIEQTKYVWEITISVERGSIGELWFRSDVDMWDEVS